MESPLTKLSGSHKRVPSGRESARFSLAGPLAFGCQNGNLEFMGLVGSVRPTVLSFPRELEVGADPTTKAGTSAMDFSVRE